MMIDGIPDRPLYFYQKDIIDFDGLPMIFRLETPWSFRRYSDDLRDVSWLNFTPSTSSILLHSTVNYRIHLKHSTPKKMPNMWGNLEIRNQYDNVFFLPFWWLNSASFWGLRNRVRNQVIIETTYSYRLTSSIYLSVVPIEFTYSSRL